MLDALRQRNPPTPFAIATLPRGQADRGSVEFPGDIVGSSRPIALSHRGLHLGEGAVESQRKPRGGTDKLLQMLNRQRSR